MKKFFRFLSYICSIFCMIIFYIIGYESVSAQSAFTISENKNQIVLPYPLCVSADTDSFISASTKNNSAKFGNGELKLFNSIPIKKVDIKVSNEKYVTPCGTPFGVKLYTRGVMVISMEDIAINGKFLNPAKDAGIQVGDVILSANGAETDTNEQLSKIISSSNGKSIKLKVRRDNVIFSTTLSPVSCDSTQYRIGIWVRDSSAGIGTMTFYDDDTGCFAGLGHGICDSDAGTILPLLSGDIVTAQISGITKSTAGSAGSLRGYFADDTAIGTILTNSERGVFGKAEKAPIENNEIPIAWKQNIHTGEAKILSTIDGNTPKYYSAWIESVSRNDNQETKNMVIHVTDEELLNKAGGIVQGMSGSPIIQDGKLVGAVTHVFVNDPTRGYAIFAENMYESISEIAQSSIESAA